MESTDFAKIIADLREAGYSDILLAKLSNCSRQYIGMIRRGETKKVGHPIGSKLTKLHEALQ